MRRGLLLALVLAVGLVSRGGRELEDVALVRVLGVDSAGAVRLTAVTGGDRSERYTARGGDILSAQEDLRNQGDRRLELTHVSQMVLGPDGALEDTLYREVTHRKSGYGATVWRAETEAGALLAQADDPAARLKSLEENAQVRAPTLMDALRELRETGQVRLPVLGSRDGELVLVGYRTEKEEKDGGQ